MLLWVIFLTHGLNLGLLHCRQILYHLRGKYGKVRLCPITKQLQDLRQISKTVQSIFQQDSTKVVEYIKFNFKTPIPTINTCNNVDGSQKLYAKRKKPDTEAYICMIPLM